MPYQEIDCSKALSHLGVHTILAGKKVADKKNPFSQILRPPGSKIRDYCLALEKVRFIGEPAAAIAARDRATTEYAAELVVN
jgi:2-furoyl-CoA dehydrogenase large subunit